MQYIRVENLYFEYKVGVPVLNNLSFSISEYGIYLILGKNGSGKSTLMRILIKYLKYKKGSVKIRDKELNEINLYDLSKDISFLESEIPSIPLSAREVISWGFYPRRGRKSVDPIAKTLGLEKLLEKDFNELSTGEKKLVLLARIFAQKSKIVLIDEPFNFLDPRYKIEIAFMLNQLAEERVVLISTHNLNAAQFIGKQIFLLGNGRIMGNRNKNTLFLDNSIMEIFDVEDSLQQYFKSFYKIDHS